MTPATKLGQWLVAQRLVTQEQMDEALRLNERDHRFLGSVLIERRWIAPERLLEALSAYFGMPFVMLRKTLVDRRAVDQVPLKVAAHFHVMPISLHDSTLRVAIADPQDIRLLDELRLALEGQFSLEPVLASEEEIQQAQKQYYGFGAQTVQDILTDRTKTGVSHEAEDTAIEDIQLPAEDASVVKLVNQLILEAHQRRATDIHLEPYRGRVRLRYRIDGMLQNVDVPPAIRQLFPAIVSRVKVLSNLNIVERRLPQDGRAGVKIGQDKLDLRIGVLPTPVGESIVIRILPSQMLLELRGLGFREDDLQRLEQAIHKPHGLIFVTGPTGSGKTTTLYACLKKLNVEHRKILTIEDPVEYELEGITQVQVNPQIGLTFAQALRSMLRHDPDVMMVGEVRDLETVELAVRIALTGHLVFSTLHTNDAVSSLLRLADMGVDPYLITSSVECILAQRLVRLLCPSCKIAAPAGSPGPNAAKPGGCRECNHTGFLGRAALYEILLLSQPIRELVLKRAPLDVIADRAKQLGMRTMREDGLDKVKQGLTTIEEVLRVAQADEL